MAESSALNTRDVTRDLFSASIGSVACCYTGQPFDTVKVRMQTNPTAFPSVMSTSSNILANEGAAALWKGAVPTALGMIAENCSECANRYASCRTLLVDWRDSLTFDDGCSGFRC